MNVAAAMNAIDATTRMINRELLRAVERGFGISKISSLSREAAIAPLLTMTSRTEAILHHTCRSDLDENSENSGAGVENFPGFAV